MFVSLDRFPEIELPNGVLGTVGESLTLICNFPILSNEVVHINWICDNTTLLRGTQSQYIVKPIWGPQIQAKTLTIDNLDVNDERYYKCEVIDDLQQQMSVGIFIEIAGEPFKIFPVYEKKKKNF